MSICLDLFYADWFPNSVHFMFIFAFFPHSDIKYSYPIEIICELAWTHVCTYVYKMTTGQGKVSSLQSGFQ